MTARRTRRLLIGLAVISITACSACSAHPVAKGTGTHWTPAQCEEDEPCWDCRTMGNRICGQGA